MPSIIFSFIIPTYNSEKTLENTLKSIRMQDFPQNEIEILVIDGGSADKTIEIAKKYDATVIPNPYKLPEPAKRLGFMCANGRYACEMDSDEEFIVCNQLSERYKWLNEYKNAHVLMANKALTTNSVDIATEYINKCGDPFSWFYYKKDDITKMYRKNKVVKQNNLYYFNKTDIFPIGDGGTTMFDLSYVKERFNERLSDQSFINTLTAHILYDSSYLICIDEDNYIHNSSASLKSYFNKLKFRVVNNVHAKEDSGFSLREEIGENNLKSKIRKFLFIPYSLFFLPSIFDGVALSVKHRNLSFLMHPIFCFYVVFEIFKQYILKIFKVNNKAESYGEK